MPAQKWVLITGVSAGGMGDALAIEFMSRDCNVIATALDLAQLEYLQPKSPSVRLHKLELDVTSTTSISAAATEAGKITNGQLDVLVNNAGYGYMMPLLDCDIEQMKRNFDVNVFGILAVTQAFFPLLKDSKGTLVNQCSIAGLTASYQPFINSYQASKSAAVKISDAFRVEVAPFGVKVVTLMTGAIETPFWQNATGAHAGLPKTSLYWPIKDNVEAMMKGDTNPPGLTPARGWAKKVVSDVLKANPPAHVRRGYLAITMWLINWLMPFWMLDRLFTRTSGLDKFKQTLEADEKKTN